MYRILYQINKDGRRQKMTSKEYG